MKIKIIDRYIYSSLILPSIFGISIFTFIFDAKCSYGSNGKVVCK